jgi:hypothetical protein
MEASSTSTKFTIGLLGAICVVAIVLAIRNHFQPSPEYTNVETPVRTMTEVASDWRTDVTRILSEYDRSQDARAAEQAMLALRVAEADREIHLKFVLAFHALGESQPQGKADLAAARQLFASNTNVVR